MGNSTSKTAASTICVRADHVQQRKHICMRMGLGKKGKKIGKRKKEITIGIDSKAKIQSVSLIQPNDESRNISS